MTEREMLRHTLATLAYRASKAVRDAPDGFAAFRPSTSSRTPAQILAHMGDLMDWGLSMSRGTPAFHVSEPLPWDQEVERFFEAVTRWDGYLATSEPLGAPMEKIVQGPIADALTHVGQINYVRRLADAPVRGESYNRAPIAIGQTRREQPAPDPKFEFD
jgi:hypothetical protein